MKDMRPITPVRIWYCDPDDKKLETHTGWLVGWWGEYYLAPVIVGIEGGTRQYPRNRLAIFFSAEDCDAYKRRKHNKPYAPLSMGNVLGNVVSH